MQPNNPFIAFLSELISRLKSDSPRVFVILQWIFGAIDAITGIPAILDGAGVVLPEPFATLESKVIAIAVSLAWIVAKLPVKTTTVAVNPDGSLLTMTDRGKLPFTAKAEKNATTLDVLNGHPMVSIATPNSKK